MYEPSPPNDVCGVWDTPQTLPGQEFERCLLMKAGWWPPWSWLDWTLHCGQAPFAVRKKVGGFTTGCPHRHTSSMPHPHATSPRCPPTHTASAAPRGREWRRSGQTRQADACPWRRNLGCRAPFGLLVGSRELVKALAIKIAPNDCLSALSGDGSDPTSALDITSGGIQVASVWDWVKSAHGRREQRDSWGPWWAPRWL